MVEAALATLEDADVVLFLVEPRSGRTGRRRRSTPGIRTILERLRAPEEAGAPGGQQDRHRPQAAAPAVRWRRSAQRVPLRRGAPVSALHRGRRGGAPPDDAGQASARGARHCSTRTRFTDQQERRPRRRAHPRAGAPPLPAGGPVLDRGGGRRLRRERARAPLPGRRPAGCRAWCGSHATLFVERDSQKAIVIGKRGAMLKTIGTDARKATRAAARHARATSTLRVKVEPRWSEQPSAGSGRWGYG